MNLPNIPPPRDLELEAQVLGAMLVDPEIVPDVMARLPARDLFDERHRVVCAAIYACHDSGLTPDPLAVKKELERIGLLERSGGLGYFSGLTGPPVPDVPNAPRYADRLQGMAVARRLIAGANQLQIRLLEGEPIADLARSLTADLGALGGGTLAGRKPYAPKIQPMSLTDFVRLYQKPVSWLWDRISPRGALWIISAMSKSGKTTLMAGALTSALLRGGELLGRRVERVERVGLILLEDRGERVLEELVAYGIVERALDGSLVPVPEFWGRLLIHVGQPDPSGFIPVAEARHLIQDNRLDVALFDTFNRFVLMHEDEDRGDVNRAALRRIVPFQSLAQQTGCTIAFSFHSNKASGDSTAITSTSGPISFVGTADVVISLGKESGKSGPNAARVLEVYLRFGGAPEKHRVTLDRDTNRLVFEPMGDAGDVGSRHLQTVLPIVAGNPGLSENGIRKLSGLGGRLIEMTLREAIDQGLIERTQDEGGRRQTHHTVTDAGLEVIQEGVAE